MGKSQRLRLRDLRSIYHVIGECRELGDDPTAWRTHLFEELRNLVGAQVACGGEMHGLWERRPAIVHSIDFGWEGPRQRTHFMKFMQQFMRKHGSGAPEFEYALRLGRRPLLTRSRTQMIPDRQWYRSAHFNEYRRPSGVDQNIFSTLTLPDNGSESLASPPSCANVITLHRGLGERPFEQRERWLVHWLHHELAPLIGPQLATAHEPSPSGLSARQQQVLNGLLEGDSEPQIAARLKLSRHTVHVHVKAVYRHFGVHSRADLLARWIRRR